MKIIAIVAHTMDGFIARSSEEFVDWSSKEDKKMFSEETKKLGVMVMGMTTYQTIGKPLKERLNIVLTSKADQQSSIPGVLEYKNTSPEQLVQELTDRGFENLAVIGGARTYTEFLKAHLIDEIWLTIEPVIFGQGVTNFNERIDGVSLLLTKTIPLNENSLQLRFKVNYESTEK